MFVQVRTVKIQWKKNQGHAGWALSNPIQLEVAFKVPSSPNPAMILRRKIITTSVTQLDFNIPSISGICRLISNKGEHLKRKNRSLNTNIKSSYEIPTLYYTIYYY